MTSLSAALPAAALNHLLRYTFTGCAHSARHAAYLLDRLAAQDGMDQALQSLCLRMSETLGECLDAAAHPAQAESAFFSSTGSNQASQRTAQASQVPTSKENPWPSLLHAQLRK